MTVDQLEAALRDVIRSGRIGVPVAVNVFAAVGAGDTEAVLTRLATLAANVLEDAGGTVTARKSERTDSWSAIVRGERGRSATIVVAANPAGRSRLDVTLYGNRGTARLEAGTCWNGVADVEATAVEGWEESLRASSTTGREAAIV